MHCAAARKGSRSPAYQWSRRTTPPQAEKEAGKMCTWLPRPASSLKGHGMMHTGCRKYPDSVPPNIFWMLPNDTNDTTPPQRGEGSLKEGL